MPLPIASCTYKQITTNVWTHAPFPHTRPSYPPFPLEINSLAGAAEAAGLHFIIEDEDGAVETPPEGRLPLVLRTESTDDRDEWIGLINPRELTNPMAEGAHPLPPLPPPTPPKHTLPRLTQNNQK